MFVGREVELSKLEEGWRSEEFQMVVVYGRRRVGKTTLIQEFCKGKKSLYFTALEQSDHDNLADFSRAVMGFFGLPASLPAFPSWHDAFDYLVEHAEQERFVFVFDEFPYAAKRNESLPSLLQVAIDHKLKGTKLFCILCGSNQGFMESEVLGQKSPLYGRRTMQLRVGQLGYLDAAKMLPGLGAQEQFRYYGCFGGVPYYLQQVRPDLGFRENVARLYFDRAGFLFDEPMGLLRQELSEPALYSSILRAIAGGANRQKEIADKVGSDQSVLPRYLKTLTSLGIIERVVPFGENPERSKKALYRIADACYDFWFRFVMPNMSSIESGMGVLVAESLPEERIDEYLGRRFERVCAEWLRGEALARRLPLPAVSVGQWWGTDPVAKAETDIDVLAADVTGKRLLMGECKYRESFDETAVLAKLEGKQSLVKGYEATCFAVFSKHPLSGETRRKCSKRGDVLLVTLEDMYDPALGSAAPLEDSGLV